MSRHALVALVLAIVPLPTAAAAQDAAEQTLLSRAVERGTLMRAYDQAGWHGTDDMLKRVPNPQGTVGGWIVDGPADAPEIVFFDKAGTRAIYTATLRDGRITSPRVIGADEDATLSPARQALVAARGAAIARIRSDGARSCTHPDFNTLVLPPAAAGAPTLVYFLSPQVKAGEYPFGGHYLVEVAADGTAGPVRAFTKSCLTMAPATAGTPGKPTAMTVSHILDPVPTEIHVFSMFASGLPVYVVTVANERLWAVERRDGRAAIRIVERPRR